MSYKMGGEHWVISGKDEAGFASLRAVFYIDMTGSCLIYVGSTIDVAI